jgi:hypothetical protein
MYSFTLLRIEAFFLTSTSAEGKQTTLIYIIQTPTFSDQSVTTQAQVQSRGHGGNETSFPPSTSVFSSQYSATKALCSYYI